MPCDALRRTQKPLSPMTAPMAMSTSANELGPGSTAVEAYDPANPAIAFLEPGGWRSLIFAAPAEFCMPKS